MSPRSMSGETYERLRRRAVVIESRIVVFGQAPADAFAEVTAAESLAAQSVIRAWLPPAVQAELDADPGRS